MRRAPGSGSPLTDVGGAWMPAQLMYFTIIRNVRKHFISYHKQFHKIPLQRLFLDTGYMRELTVRVLGRQESGVLGVRYTPVGVPEIVAGSINVPVFVVWARSDRWLASGALWGCGYLAETIKASAHA